MTIRDVRVINDFRRMTYRVVNQPNRQYKSDETPLPLPEKTTPYESEWEQAKREAHESGDGPLALPAWFSDLEKDKT